MVSLSARRVLSACIASAASVAVLAAPGVASAKAKVCTGENITGQGSSLQAEAQVVWTKEFNVNTKAGCTGATAPKVKYTSTGSGAGYKSWAGLAENEKKELLPPDFSADNAFIGTDNTVNEAEKETIESKQTGTGGTVLTIPVLQGAVSIPINLPENCVASSTPASGRLALNNSTLEEIFAGKITKWSQIAAAEGTGNKLTGEGCNPETAITVVVRQDGSGTTHIFKRYLNLIFNSPLASEDGKTHTWGELSEGSLSTTWPTATKVKKPAKSTGPEVLKLVAATPGSIGYANLADARNEANGGFTGQSPQRFWAELENSKKVSGSGKITRKYADPSSNGDVKAKAASNCKSTIYSNGSAAFPPPTVGSPWNEVTAELVSKTYSLCGLTYDLALKKYSAYPGTTPEEAATVKEYLGYEVNKKGGQADIKNEDYSELPKELLSESAEGIEGIS